MSCPWLSVLCSPLLQWLLYYMWWLAFEVSCVGGTCERVCSVRVVCSIIACMVQPWLGYSRQHGSHRLGSSASAVHLCWHGFPLALCMHPSIMQCSPTWCVCFARHPGNCHPILLQSVWAPMPAQWAEPDETPSANRYVAQAVVH